MWQKSVGYQVEDQGFIDILRAPPPAMQRARSLHELGNLDFRGFDSRIF